MITGSGFDDSDQGAESSGLQEEAEPLEIPSRPCGSASFDEIMAELELRFETFIFAGDARQHDDEHQTRARYHGSFTTAVGHAERFKHWLLHGL